MVNKLIQIIDSRKTVFIVFLGLAFFLLCTQNNQAGFGSGHHGFLSSHGATLAKNLSLKDNFLMYESISIQPDGTKQHQTYSRFPFLSFWVIKMFMAPFSSSLSMEILVARQVMNLFFLGAMLFVFFSVCELSRSNVVAVTVTLFSFSSFYLNYYNDMIFNDTPTFFGFVMAFHGIVLYHLYNKRKQLYLKAAVGLMLGWHVYSMLLGYIAFTLTLDFFQNWSIPRIIKSDSFRLGLMSLFIGFVLLAFNFTNEAITTGKPITEINSFQSAKNRVGQNESFTNKYHAYLAWGAFTREQLRRIGAMSIPYYFKKNGNFQLVGAFALVAAIIGSWFFSYRILLYTLLASGFIWAFPMRGYTFSHDYQSIYYIGLPVTFFYIITAGLNKKFKPIFLVLLPLAIWVFLSTNLTFNQSKALAAQKVNPVTADFQNIVNYTGSGNIFFIDGDITKIAYGFHAVQFYLSGNYFTSDRNFAEYIISRNRQYNSLLLTPKNTEIFLFQGKPHFARAYTTRGIGYYRQDQYMEAIADFDAALQKDLRFVEAYINRGMTRKKMKDFRGAIQDYNQALSIAPKAPDALNNLSWILSTCREAQVRNGERALQLAKRLVGQNQNVFALDTLAAAYAELKKYDEAVATQKEAVRIAENQRLNRIVLALRKHLAAYQQQLPWRE